MKTHRTVTNFETREEISYLRLVQYLINNYSKFDKFYIQQFKYLLFYN
jgi:hypothetical protein